MGSVGALILTRTFSAAGTVGCQTEGRRRIPWTGYSSLHRLKTLPIDLLKIDRSFVRDVATDPDSATLTTAMISLARNQRLEVVAEGVETEEQMALPVRPRMRPGTGLPPQPPAPRRRAHRTSEERKAEDGYPIAVCAFGTRPPRKTL
jgi:hypothetical protein